MALHVELLRYESVQRVVSVRSGHCVALRRQSDAQATGQESDTSARHHHVVHTRIDRVKLDY